MMFSLFILAILLVSASVEAVYLRAEKASRRDVYIPKITSPTAKTVWVAGTTVDVTWSVFSSFSVLEPNAYPGIQATPRKTLPMGEGVLSLVR